MKKTLSLSQQSSQPGASGAAQDMLFLAPAATSGRQTLNQPTTIPCGQPLVPNLREGLAPTLPLQGPGEV